MTTDDHAAASPTPAVLDQLERARRRMLLAVVATSAVWLAPQIVIAVSESVLPGTVVAALSAAGVVGAVTWMVFMWRFHRFQASVQRQPELRRLLNDERIVAVRREAVFRTWAVMIVMLAAGVAAGPFVPLPGQAVVLALLLVAVDAPILFFLALDRG